MHLRLIALALATTAAIAQPVIIRTTTLIDGRGHILSNQEIAIEGGKITSIGPAKSRPTIDLSGLTVMPGWIDTHVHPNYYFNRENRLEQGPGPGSIASAEQATLCMMANLYATLMAGFTTVQSPGSVYDIDLRDMIARDAIPGPRLLTSVGQLNEKSGSPDQLRAQVDRFKAQGADLIKLFATASVREGGKMTMTAEQINAVCGEANRLGLRTLVHSHASDATTAAVEAGCTSIEHGTFLDDTTLRLMASRGVYFDPNFVMPHNYLDNKSKYLGIGNYTEEGFTYMEKAIPLTADVLKRARKANVKVVLGTDAVAGAHGRNAEEFIYRVKDGGDTPMNALMSGTSVAAESLRMSSKIGSLEPGMEADIVATERNPLDDITAVRKVAFVMKHGKVLKNNSARR
jgi:imidazolonepropionase-like amidohydrolase